MTYKCSTYYDTDVERGFHYADPEVGIEWPRDRDALPLRAIAGELPF